MTRFGIRSRPSTLVSTWLPTYSAVDYPVLSLSPLIWVDASKTDSITTVSGRVTEWRDLSGNNNHLTQASNGPTPRFNVAGMNGLDTILFGADGFADIDVLGISSIGLNIKTVLIVAQATGTAYQNGPLITHGGTSLTRPSFELKHYGENQNAIAYINNSTETLVASSLSGLTSPHLITARYTDETEFIIRLNRQQVGTSVATIKAPSTGVFSVGGKNYGNNSAENGLGAYKGNISEIICLSYTLQNATLDNVELYLKTKWGTL